MTAARIASLHIYPVKGCAGIAVDSAEVAATGLVIDGAGDREWMVVDGHGRFVTQREHPRLALVTVRAGVGALQLAAPGTAELVIALDERADTSRAVALWRSKVRGFDAGEDAAAWISAWLGATLRIVRFDRAVRRTCNSDFAGNAGAHTLFADGYPVLVIARASLDDLNVRLTRRGSEPLPMNRFRPNVVLDGIDAYAEDHLDTVEAGGVTLRCVKPCVRCRVTTTNQESAEVGLEPLRTLGEYRMNERLSGITFGSNAIVLAGAGRSLSIGAEAHVSYAF